LVHHTTQTAMRLAEQLKAHVQATVLDTLFGGNPDIEVSNIRFSYAGSKGMYAGGIAMLLIIGSSEGALGSVRTMYVAEPNRCV
jgi:hypothetical protein